MKPLLEDVKAHLRIDSADEDSLIQGLVDAAYVSAGNYLRRDLDVDYPVDLPAPIMVAVLMHTGSLFDNRAAATEETLAAVPFGYRLLLEPYRNFPTV